ncbi:hypothetical protein [Cohnella sp. AR92]|uniref:hypothetical protein n=1 Tax=Cohnella sp. AR92 TaxID=648716 RepID=UPI000F8EBF2E|nr:hypothetical protein [Cohnella sp. AR92]RUS48853.1 hypothetical protein ELR57_00435 [Cohnella sp. AR92]
MTKLLYPSDHEEIVLVSCKEVSSNQIDISDADNRYQLLLIDGGYDRYEQRHLEWFRLIEKVCGWSVYVFEVDAELESNILIDQTKRRIFINRRLLKRRFKALMQILNRLINFLNYIQEKTYECLFKRQ